MEPIVLEDLNYIMQSSCIPWDKLRNENILISGATGLIGSTLVQALLYATEKLDLNLHVYCIVRDLQKAKDHFVECSKSNNLHFIHQDITEAITSNTTFGYIIHGASPTASSFFIQHPVNTINVAFQGTNNLLERGIKDKIKGFLFLSSMEAYGLISCEQVLTEDKLGLIDLSNTRSSYSETKRMCELLTTSYFHENNIRAMNVRLAQTFGPGVSINDSRVFAMMARCALRLEDIVLLTKGTSRHPYLYTAQAVTALLCVLLNGEGGETYNAANPDTYCSIYEMGTMVAKKIAHGQISVKISESNENKKYPPASYLNLNIDKIRTLGWKPYGTLEDMYQRMMATM